MELREIIGRFAVEGTLLTVTEYGNGHINDTYLVEMQYNGILKKYIFQRMNTTVFQNTVHLMENVAGVSSYLRERVKECGGDEEREVLWVIPLRTGEGFYRDFDGSCYRMFQFIEDATSFESVEKPEDFYESAVAFGNFQFLLADYPAATLHETIPDFHNTGKRYADFAQAVRADICGRVLRAEREISFVMDRQNDMRILTRMLERGELPLRVTHNDTKLNNVMIDNKTGKGVCVIDLDTVMPGISPYDFGDSIRFGANTAKEDEPDVTKVSLDLNLYELYVKGYIEGCRGSLTENELRMLPMGAKIMTLECGMRFLADYLQKDVYFKIHRENHNLERSRTQFALVEDMEEKWSEMEAIVRKYS